MDNEVGMSPFLFRDMVFNADVETAGAFTCFDPARPEATDTGPSGMVAEMDAFLRLTAGKKRFVDVGALFGMFSMVFTQRPGTSAIAIEASPWAFPILERQIAGNPNRDITALNRFVGDASGRAVECSRDWKHVIANLASGAEKVTLQESTIDEIMANDHCDVMKIDVEAYEVHALRGARQTIDRCKPLLFVECHMNNLPDNGESRESLMRCFVDMDYRVEQYDGTEVTDFSEGSMTRVVAWPK